MTAKPNEDLEIQEINSKNSKLEAIEFMREMAGYPQMDYSIIAKRMNIPQSTARDYVKRYIWGVLHTMHDTDYPRRLLEIYNHDTVSVPPAKALTRKDINHLNPVVNKYAKYTVEHPEVQKRSQGMDNSTSASDQTRTVGMHKPKPRTVVRNVRQEDDDEGEEDDDEEEDDEERFSPQKLMAPVAGSNNAQYINAILIDIPGIPSPKIEKYLGYFTKNEADYMANPDRFKKELKVWFGDGPGEMIFNSFHYGMSTFGRTGQGLGVNPYTGQPYSGSSASGTDWMKNNPNLETYYKMGIIPYGVPPDSGIAIEAVNSFHEKQRRKEQREEEDESFNRWLKARTAKAMEENIGGGQNRGNEMNNITQLLAAGVVELQVGVDESGHQVMKYVPKRRDNNNGGLFGGGGNGNDPNVSLLNTIISGKDALINTLISKSMETPKIMESLLGKFIQNMDPDPTVQLTRLKQVSETMFPNNNIQNSIEAVRLKLEQTRLEKDMTMADNEARRQFEKDKWEKERAERMEIEAGKNTQNIMNGILGLGKEMMGPAMAMLSGKGIGGLFPGGQMPGAQPNPFGGFQGQPQNPYAQQNPFVQQSQQRPQPQQGAKTLSPETYAYMKQVEEAKGQQQYAGPSPGFAAGGGRSFRPFQDAPPRRPVMQGQPMGQDVIEEYNETPHMHQHVHQPQPRVYSPSEFDNASPETLQNAEREILKRKAELDNYLNSLRVAKRKRSNVFRTKRPTPEPEYQIAPTVGGGSTAIDTTVYPDTQHHQEVTVVNPRSETGSVEIPDMVPEKVQREEVNVPSEVKDEPEIVEEEDVDEYEGEDEDEDDDGEEEIEEAVEEEHDKK